MTKSEERIIRSIFMHEHCEFRASEIKMKEAALKLRAKGIVNVEAHDKAMVVTPVRALHL